jgi:centractin
LTEPPLNPRSNRDTAAQILFETFNVPALYTSIQAVLSLYASGRTTGIVLDAGDGVSHAVPVYEGFAMPSSIRRIDVAGRDVTEHMQMLLRKAGYVFHTSAEKEVVRMIKEKVSYVAADPKREEKEWASAKLGDGKVVEYALPDGNKIKVRQFQLSLGVFANACRLGLNDSAPPKSSLILRSLVSNTQESTRS